MEKKVQKRTDRRVVSYVNRRFLRYLVKYHKYELVLSRVYNKWEETYPEMYREIEKRKLWPMRKVLLINIVRTLIKLGNEPNRATVKLARRILRKEGTTIENYIKIRKQRYLMFRIDNRKPIIQITPQQAKAEQIAQGFIKVSEFKDMNNEGKHCYSLVDRELIYPYNFSSGTNDLGTRHIIEGLELVGVAGYSRITQ